MHSNINLSETGTYVYHGPTFRIELFRYTDPNRLNLADSAAVYLGKPDTDNIRRPLNILKRGDVLEIFRGESATFKFFDVAKQVYDHLTTYTTRQMRVAGGNRALVSEGYTMPIDKMKNPEEVETLLNQAMDNYYELASSETPQIARSIMPVNANMHPFKLQFNFQTLIESLFTQRIWEKGAQGLTVEVVKGMYALCHAVDPELWEAALEYHGPHVKEWKEVQKRLRKSKITLGYLFDRVTEDEPWLRDKPIEEVLRDLYGQTKSMW